MTCRRYKVQPGLPGSAGFVTINGRRRALPATPGGRHVEICRGKGALVMIDASGGRHKIKRRR
jgi:hypothetical protein